MSTINYLTVRNTILPVVNAVTANYSTLTGSTITATSMNLTSATISLGQSTNQTYNNFSNGSYLTWATAKEAMTSANKTVQSANGLYQMIVGNATSGLFLSSDSGITWSTLTGGLPTLTGSAYWSDGAISANGQYITLSIYGGSLWMSADYGRTFALTNQPTPNIWLPLNGNTTDSMGLSVVTTPGTVPGYVTLNYPGYTAQAVNLANTAGGTATRYVRGTWAGSPNFTVSFWMNPQTVNGSQQTVFSTYTGGIQVYIQPSTNYLFYQIPSGGASGVINGQVVTTYALSVNTWYYVTIIFQTNGLCSLYVNNTLIGSATNVGGYGTYVPTPFSLGTYDTATTNAFNGYIDDLRITNSVSTYVPIPLLQPNIWLPFENTAGDLGSYSLPPSATPTIYLPFEGNVTDSMSFTTVTVSSPTPPTYVAANREGYTGQAVNLANTAGSNATRYVRGTWTGAANFTVSFWMNPQSFAGVQLQVFAAYAGGMVVYINPSNQLAWYMPSGGAGTGVTMGTTSFALVTNTWYYVTIIFQTSGVCSFYVNNALIANYTNVSGVGTMTTTQFSLGCNDNSIGSSFNGYIDDLRIYNSAIPYVPVSNVTVGGSLSYVPGVVGLNAVNLVNTAGGTATNYIRGALPALTTFTVSGWFNIQSWPSSGTPIIFATGTGAFIMYINPGTAYTLNVSCPTGVTSGTNSICTTSALSLNTWYNFAYIFQPGATAFYLNGVQVGSTYTAGTGVGSFSTSSGFGLGSGDTGVAGNAFNGYIDDFRIYSAAIPYHILFPQNYRSLALSGTGQYALASAASGWVVGSSDSSKTWSKQAVCVGTQNELVQPQLTGLAAASWLTSGVSWTASASTFLSGYNPYKTFNNTTSDSWANSVANYTSSGNTSGQTTVVQGTIGTVTGDWLQLQSSVPLVISSYQFSSGSNSSQHPKTYYIVGSNDGTTWYPIQFGSGVATPISPAFTIIPNTIIVYNTGAPVVQTFGSSTITTTAYSTAANAYTYFRIIGLSIYATSGYFEIGEWYINFARIPTQALSMNHTGQYQLVATGPAAGSVMPNQTGLLTNTWTQGGVNWRASASSRTSADYDALYAFNNSLGSDSTGKWTTGNPVYTTSGNSSGFTTVIQGVVTATGDWLQIQSSVPLVMASYQFATGYAANRLPKTYYIVGSNDGSTWFPIQFGSGTGSGTASQYTLVTSAIIVNSASTQTFGSSTITTTTYSSTTNAYLYFRLITLTNYTSTVDHIDIGEWYMNFSNSVSYSANYGSTWLNTSSVVSNESVALSASGQYTLSTNSVAPFARLTFDNTNADVHGVFAAPTMVGTPGYSTSIKTVGTHSIQFANATVGGTPTVYLNYTVPTILNKPSALTMSFWMYPTGYAATSYVITLSNGTQLGPYFYFRTGTVGLAFNINGGAIQYAEYAQGPPLNSWTHIAMTITGSLLSFYMNGVLLGTMPTSGSLTLSNGGNITNLFVGTLTASTGAFAGNVDDVRIYTSALNADEINGLYKNPDLTQTIAVSNSYLPITSYTKPVLPSITANIVDTAVSQTGQYMVAVTSSTTNNVYYSTDYGATFTALTIGTAAMVSCSISYDGSYLTATNATTTYTLNRNTRGFSVTVGNQAGLVNQAQNAIAIGNQAGRTNQSANSIVLNASGVALDAVAPGFYVAPVGTTTSSNATSFALLGYGTDNQVTQTNLTVLSNGSVGLGTVAPNFPLDIFGGAVSITSSGYTPYLRLQSVFGAAYLSIGSVFGVNTYIGLQCGVTTTSALGTPTLVVTNAGTVGIGTQNPGATLDVLGASVSNAYSDTFILNTRASDSFNGDGGNTIYSRSINLQSGDLTWTGNRNYGARIYIGGGYSVNAANNHGNIVFYTSNAERMRINSAGNVSITGTLSKGGGTFDITHPLYPDTNKRLVHSFIEGPRCDLIYRGKTTLINGTAIVDINKECTHSPECAMDDGTFEALCDNPQIFLQNNQSFDRVRGVISGATLTITCENPASVEIEWMVIAERADPFIKKWDRTNPDGYLITQYTSENNIVEPPSQ